MKLIKLTDKNGRTGPEKDMQWGEKTTNTVKIRGRTLCSKELIHAYTNAYLAILLNPICGDYDEKTMLAWEAKGRVVARDGIKVGCKSLTTIKQIAKPTLTTEQRVEIGIRCAMKIYSEASFIKWANNWLDNKDKTAWTAVCAYKAIVKDTDLASWACWVVWSAAWSAAGTRVDVAAWVAAWAAARAADAAIKAVGSATDKLDIVHIIESVVV